MNILDKIVASKRIEIQNKKEFLHPSKFEESIFFHHVTHSLAKSIKDTGKSSVIAEFKRRSPSKGIINDTSRISDVVTAYEKYGASGISILTDREFFGGKPLDIQHVRNKVTCPILRKDFIIDEYQILEAKAIGADAILLIAAILEKKEGKRLYEFAKKIQLEVVFEIHDDNEIDKIPDSDCIIGINNRNLKTFEINIEKSIEIAERLPKNTIKISESGIENPEIIRQLKRHGYDGFLIGENFMKTNDPGKAFAEFVKQL